MSKTPVSKVTWELHFRTFWEFEVNQFAIKLNCLIVSESCAEKKIPASHNRRRPCREVTFSRDGSGLSGLSYLNFLSTSEWQREAGLSGIEAVFF